MSRFVIITTAHVLKGRISQFLWFQLHFHPGMFKDSLYKHAWHVSNALMNTQVRSTPSCRREKRPDDMYVSSGCFFKRCRTHTIDCQERQTQRIILFCVAKRKRTSFDLLVKGSCVYNTRILKVIESNITNKEHL